MLEGRQLRCFVAVTQHLHFGKAADSLHIAQSALSAHIKHLEEHLGAQLLNRGKRSAVSLTDAGRLFLAEAQQALWQLERAEHAGRRAGRGELGQVDLGYVASAAICGILPASLGAFRAGYADVNLRVVQMDTPRQLQAIADGALDLGIVRPRPIYPDDIKIETIHHEKLALAIGAGNPLAAEAVILSGSLTDQHFIAPQFDEAAGFADYLARLGTKIGTPLNIGHKVSDFMTALSLSAAGYGVVLVPVSFARMCIDGLVFRTIEDYDEMVSLAVAWRRFEASASVLAMVALLTRNRRGLSASSAS